MDVLLALLTRNSCMWRQIWHAKDICLVLSEMKHATGHESRHCFSEPSQSAVRGEDNDWRQLCNISRREQHFCRNSISVGRFPAGWYSGLYWQYQLLCVREYSTVAVGCEDESILQCHIFLCSVSQSLAHINMSCDLIKLTRFFFRMFNRNCAQYAEQFCSYLHQLWVFLITWRWLAVKKKKSTFHFSRWLKPLPICTHYDHSAFFYDRLQSRH